ncbi:hypothetical protein N9M16_06655 [Candidatus Dependentiae bacterium]|nr:hypothetical protein [Candidatus Dependentiae bacterium]
MALLSRCAAFAPVASHASRVHGAARVRGTPSTVVPTAWPSRRAMRCSSRGISPPPPDAGRAPDGGHRPQGHHQLVR